MCNVLFNTKGEVGVGIVPEGNVWIDQISESLVPKVRW